MSRINRADLWPALALAGLPGAFALLAILIAEMVR